MKGKREMRNRVMEIDTHFAELADKLEQEKRQMTDAEREEKDALVVERQAIELRLFKSERGWQPSPQQVTNERAFAELAHSLYQNKDIPENMRSIVDGRGEVTIPSTRAIQDAQSAEVLIPLVIEDIVPELEKGLILDKVGIKMQYGVVGQPVFPVVAGVEATIEDENAEISDTTIDISKINSTPKRVAISIPVSNRAIDQTNGVILDIVKSQLSKSVARLLNKWMFNPTRITTKASDGCFVEANKKPAVTGPASYKNAVALEAAVLKEGVVFDGSPAYVCSATTYAELKTTPVDAGSGKMVLEDRKINGYPVHITEFIGDGVLGFGVFSYEMVIQYGDMRMIIDPYTGAKKNLVHFVFNSDFDVLTVIPQAFAVQKIAAAGGETK